MASDCYMAWNASQRPCTQPVQPFCPNRWRYSYLKGRSSSPWSRGVIQNIRELFHPTEDWKHYYDLPASMLPAPTADLLV
jgi:hypothetical protein